MTDQTDRLAQIAQRHTVTVTLSGDRSPYVPIYSFKCHSPEGAPCRQRCRNDDICEGGDAEGHIHEWYDSGECWMLGWWENDDATPENLVEPLILKDLPVKGWWGDDCVEWKFVGPPLSDLVDSLTKERDALAEEASSMRVLGSQVAIDLRRAHDDLARLRAVIEEARALAVSDHDMDTRQELAAQFLAILDRGLKDE